jgi:hypothetical protein
MIISVTVNVETGVSCVGSFHTNISKQAVLDTVTVDIIIIMMLLLLLLLMVMILVLVTHLV